jgi:transcription antitermination factor NusG
LPVLTTPGVLGIISFSGAPAPIPESEIEAVRVMMQSGLVVTPWPYLQIGQRVVIEHGPLTGVEGLLEQTKGAHRLVVSIPMLQRSVSTEIDRDWVRPVKPRPTQEFLGQQRTAHSQAYFRRN